MEKKTVILASGSPRRRELIKMLGMPYKAVSVDADETFDPAKNPYENAINAAGRKAAAAAALLGAGNDAALGIDTIVVCKGRVFGKPKSFDECMDMLRSYSGESHNVISGVSIVSNEKSESFSVETIVTFCEMSEAAMAEYASSDEPYDKAGGYGIQGRAALYISGIIGDYYNVMGFPVQKVHQSLKSFGF
ncbi:MAG: Maf family protein [Eubacteriaceae bacterium]|nr:Maf family protein [Eubacteriaceae bacterium]